MLVLPFASHLAGVGAGSAAAQVAVGARAGSGGLGIEVSAPLGSRLAARGVYGGAEIDLDFDSDRVDYEGELEPSGLLAVVDWHPAGRSFRLSGGLYLNDLELRGRAPVRELLVESGAMLPPGLPMDLGTLEAAASGEEVAPYVGLGWGKAPRRRGWGASFELGVAFIGEPDVSVEPRLAIDVGAVPGGQALVDAFVREEEQELEDELSDAKLYPLVSIGVVYRF